MTTAPATTQPIECAHCHAIFFDFATFNDHIATNHQTEAALDAATSTEGPPRCPGCDYKPPGDKPRHQRANLKRHWSRYPSHRGQDAVSAVLAPPPDDAPAPSDDAPHSTLDATILREPSLPDDLAALEARVAHLEEELYRLSQHYNVHSRAKDAHENPGSRLGVN